MSEISKELGSFLDIKEEEDPEIIKQLNGLDCKKNAVFLTLIAPYGSVKISPSKEVSASLGISEEFGVETAIEDIRESTSCKNLVLLVNSPGGFVGSSYKIAKALRKNFDKITVFIPHIAASGGTLLSLSGNEIVMGMMSQLGPIDPSTDGKPALCVVRGFENITSEFEKISESDAPYPWKVLAQKYSAIELDEAYSSLMSIENYAKEILILGKLDATLAQKIASHLVRGFLTHGDVIDFDKAKEIGLNIVEHSKYKKEWEILRSWLGKYLLTSSDKHIIRYYVSDECKKEAKQDV